MNSARSSESGSLLLVEDHAPTRDILVRVLSTAFPGLSVSSASTGGEALALCRERPPVVVVMDIHLPDGNGIDVVRTLKTATPEVGVVMHSNHDIDVFREHSTAAGADAFVSKTEGPAALLSAIRRLLDVEG